MDGGLSFVEQGCESKRPGNEVKIFKPCDKLLIEWDQYSGTRRANVLGRHFFAYFLVAADKKVRRHQAKQIAKKITLYQCYIKKTHPNNPSFSILDNPLISHSRFPATDREATHS